MARHKIRVTRKLTYSYECTWPDDYPGMTYEETLEYERNLELADVVEALHDSDELKADSPVIEVTDMEEDSGG